MADSAFLVAGGAAVVFFLCLLSPLLPLGLLALALLALGLQVRLRQPPRGVFRVAFFHPFTNDGGGGERVLWCMARALQDHLQNSPARLEWVVYTGDEATPASLAARARNLFGVELHQEFRVVPLRLRSLVEAATWPRFTLLGQSLGSVALAAEALLRCTPSLFVDTAGYAFSYPVVKLLAGCPVAAYTHYPTISTDMVQRVKDRTSIYNNSSAVASSSSLSALKLLYYRGFASLYGLAGWCADVAMVNSSWTEGHIRSLWRWTPPQRIHRVYPPCDTAALQMYPFQRPDGGERFIISVAQFRPEKNHSLQLRAFAQAIEEAKKDSGGEEGEDQVAGLPSASSSTDPFRHEGEVSSSAGSTSASAPPGSLGSAGTGPTAASNKESRENAPPDAPPVVKSKSGRGWAGAALGLLSFRRGSKEPSAPAAASAAQGSEGQAAVGGRAGKHDPLEGVRLKLVGGSRNKQDEERIDLLASLADQLGISGRVDFCVNMPFRELQELLGTATCGLHSMLDEHFGISIVEYMAAGALVIAHNSGGPRADILQPVEEADGSLRPVGFLAKTVDEYSAAIRSALSMLPEERIAVATRARKRAATYSEVRFAEGVKSCLKTLLPA